MPKQNLKRLNFVKNLKQLFSVINQKEQLILIKTKLLFTRDILVIKNININASFFKKEVLILDFYLIFKIHTYNFVSLYRHLFLFETILIDGEAKLFYFKMDAKNVIFLLTIKRKLLNLLNLKLNDVEPVNIELS